ncbi:MAG TPA: alpha/beta fold hydrolase [Longimicrobium sp.]|jgi:dipeptidyl aminopeptidase/acylaminoacyl peptidase
MKPTLSFAPVFNSTRAGSAAGPGTRTGTTRTRTALPRPGRGVGAWLRRALVPAAVVVLTACGEATGKEDDKVDETCSLARPDFGGPATAADRALFAYDANSPLNLQQTVESTENGVQVSKISFDSPAGGTVTGILAEPVGRTGLRPGLILLQPFPAAALKPLAQLFANVGAVVIVIDVPGFRRGGEPLPRYIPEDRAEHIQTIKDLRRAIDVLTARADVDDARIGFVGNSYGGFIGAHLVGVDQRFKAAVLSTVPGGWVSLRTTPEGLKFMATLSCATRNAWFQNMVPVEPIRYIGNAAPTELLFQIANLDTTVPLQDAQAVYDAASNPKEVMYYDVGHALNAQSFQDRLGWLHDKLGLD